MHLGIGCGHPETDKPYCVNQHANMRMLVHGHTLPPDQSTTIQIGNGGVYMSDDELGVLNGICLRRRVLSKSTRELNSQSATARYKTSPQSIHHLGAS